MNRIIWWHIPYPGAPLPRFYIERDYTPERLRILAERAPENDCEIDIRDDDVTIFNNRTSVTETRSTVYSEIGYNTLAVSTFKVGENVTGGTSGARGEVVSDARGNMTLILRNNTVFSADETITGATSGATAKVLIFYRGGNPVSYSDGTAKTTGVLPAGATLEPDADDFIETTIEEGSWLSCHEINLGGAQNVTVQLELDSLDEEDDEEPD